MGLISRVSSRTYRIQIMPHCHYEILSISMDADDSAIKKSYRKLALKYHPDKNQDNLEHATEQFRLVQAAYDCLSDPHERQWYDDHRDAILKGKKIGAENGSDSEMDDDGQDLYGFMTGLAFEGFDEELKPKTNYFAVYHELFQRIDEEEPSTGKSQREDGPLPFFGNSASCWEDVNMFYGYWEGFSTRKTYGYLDKWDTRQAPDRWVRRKMEQENKKVREEARKNKNKIVRELVRFVRRRDPRVAKQKEKLEEENQRKKKLQEDKRKERLAAEIEAQVEYEEKMWEDENTWRQYEELAELEAKLEAEEENDEFAFTGKRGKKGKKGKKNKKKWSSDDEEIIVEENPVDENGKEIKNSDQDLENKSVPTPSYQPKKKGKKGKKNKNKTPSEKPASTKKNWRLKIFGR